MADVHIDEAAKQEWDLIALPGGMPGTYNDMGEISILF
jgi:hypothetical protein